MKRIFSAVFLALTTTAPITGAWAEDRPTCREAGPGAAFCTGNTFSRLDDGVTDGLSFWMDRAGYLSKVLVQTDPDGDADQALIESQILAMVSRQASDIGRDFAFSDVTSTTAGGAPFGTLSYSLAREGRNQAILHSYVAVKGIVIQVISQIALKGADRDPEALMLAHHRALDAIELTSRDAAL
jgi:hypothetical protein